MHPPSCRGAEPAARLGRVLPQALAHARPGKGARAPVHVVGRVEDALPGALGLLEGQHPVVGLTRTAEGAHTDAVHYVLRREVRDRRDPQRGEELSLRVMVVSRR